MENQPLFSLVLTLRSSTVSTSSPVSSLSISSPFSASSSAMWSLFVLWEGAMHNIKKILLQPIFLFRREIASFQIDISQKRQGSTRSQWKNLRMSVFQVIVFAVFWAPYVIHQSWWVLINLINVQEEQNWRRNFSISCVCHLLYKLIWSFSSLSSFVHILLHLQLPNYLCSLFSLCD